MEATEPARRLALAELVAVVLAGALHVVTELAASLAVSRVYNVVVVAAFLAHLVRRVARDRSLPRAGGLRADGLPRSLAAYGVFVLVAAGALLALGASRGVEPELRAAPLALYLAWGLAQQFALQNLLAANLARLVAPAWLTALLASLLFGASHVPRLELAGLACGAGLVLVLLYRRFPNLLAAGVAHGVLGWLAFGCLGLRA